MKFSQNKDVSSAMMFAAILLLSALMWAPLFAAGALYAPNHTNEARVAFVSTPLSKLLDSTDQAVTRFRTLS